MPANQGHQPPKKRAAKREGESVGAKSDGALQPVGKRRPRAKAKPEIEPAKRISGVCTPDLASSKWDLVSSGDVTAEQLAREPNTTVKLSKTEAVWRREVERAAKDDPEAYLARCRAPFER